MKLISWNLNGIRAAHKGGFLDWFANEKADIICVQEIKAKREQLEQSLVNPHNYHSFWHSAEKPGYSGVALFSKVEPHELTYGLGDPTIDSEGRVIIAEYANFVLINAYFPNSQRDHARLPYKLQFCQKILKCCEKFRSQGKAVILCGDYNIAHREIDLKNPKSNENNAGFLPQERAWMDEFLKAGYVDVFRSSNLDGGHYTWWSYRPGVRQKNIGWRLDYHCVNKESADRVKGVGHQPHVKGSDHCPVFLELKH